MIEIKNLRKTYGKKVALKSFSYTFEDGIYGMLGANGAGKSTLMNLLTESPKKSGKKDESWWSKRQKRMKELMKRQQKAALKRAQERRNVTDIYEENIDIFTESMMGGKNGTEYF